MCFFFFWGGGYQRESKGERDRQTDRQTDRDRDRETDRQTETETDRQRQRQRQRQRPRGVSEREIIIKRDEYVHKKKIIVFKLLSVALLSLLFPCFSLLWPSLYTRPYFVSFYPLPLSISLFSLSLSSLGNIILPLSPSQLLPEPFVHLERLLLDVFNSHSY